MMMSLNGSHSRSSPAPFIVHAQVVNFNNCSFDSRAPEAYQIERFEALMAETREIRRLLDSTHAEIGDISPSSSLHSGDRRNSASLRNRTDELNMRFGHYAAETIDLITEVTEDVNRDHADAAETASPLFDDGSASVTSSDYEDWSTSGYDS